MENIKLNSKNGLYLPKDLEQKTIIVMDSSSGAGATSTGKDLGEILRIQNFFSAGEFYRAVTLYALENCMSPQNLVDEINNISIELANNQFRINGEELNRNDLHTPKISQNVANYSPNKQIRDKIEEMIKESVLNCCDSAFIEGRPLVHELFGDISESIFGIYMTADARTRAQRRYKQHKEDGEEIQLEKVLKDIKKRDFQDSNREYGKFLSIEEAQECGLYDLIIDNTNLTKEETIELISDKYYEKFKHAA